MRNLTKLLLTFLLLTIGQLPLSASDFEVDGICYNVIGSGEVEVTKGGDYTGDVVIPSKVSYAGEVYSVTTIGNEAFFGCKFLTTVTIPEGVVTIGKGAFGSCESLASATLPRGVTTIPDYTFGWCNSLTSVTIPDGVTSIGKWAFYGCESLGSLTLPGSMTTIGEWTFSECNSLTSVTLPEGMISIGEKAFQKCQALTNVSIPGSMSLIGMAAFIGCPSLTSIDVSPDNPYFSSIDGILYKSPEQEVWAVPGALTSVVIPDGVKSIGTWAFAHGNITSVSIPGSVTTIGELAFYDCKTLTSLTMAEGVATIGISAFANCISLTSVTIPEGVTTIDKGAFGSCNSLASVTLPETVITIGENAFIMCPALVSVTIPEGVTSIGENAFSGGYSLASVTLPESLTSIGNSAFSWCSVLETIYNYSKEPQKIEQKVFDGVPSTMIVYVPKGRVEAYEGAEVWKKFTIKEMEAQETPSTFTVNGICYNVIGSGEVEVTKGEGYSEEIVIPTTVTYEGVEYTVTKIGSHAFDGCDQLTSVKIPEGVITIGEYAFSVCFGLTSVTIPGSVTTIEESAFYNCVSLTTVNIPEGVTTIGDRAFQECLALASVTIPGSISTIGKWAFSACLSLTSVSIPEGVTMIGEYAFSWCSVLETVYSYSQEPQKIEANVFERVPSSMTVYVPKGCLEAYESAEVWKGFTIREMEDNPDNGIGVIGGDRDEVRVYCRDGEVRIENRPVSEPVTVCSQSGAQLYTGFADCVRVDGDSPIVIVRVGAKSYKLVVR